MRQDIEDDGIDWEELANKYEKPPPFGAMCWGMGSFYKVVKGKVFMYVNGAWIRSSKTSQAVMCSRTGKAITGYVRVEE
jgi:hypothetical protein